MKIWRRAAVLLMALAALVMASPEPGAGADRIAVRFDRVLAELELSEEQRERVLALRGQYATEMRALVEALSRKAADLRGRIEETPGEPRAIEELVQEIGRMQTEMLRARVRAIRELRELLHARQQAKLRELEESLRRGRGKAGPR